MPYCKQHGIAFLAYSPLGRGLLTGKAGPARQFSETDQRYGDPRFSKENRQSVADMLEKLQPICQEWNGTIAQLAIAWAIHQPGVTHALVGARNPRQAEENAQAGRIELTEDQLGRIAEVIGQNTDPKEH